MCSGFMASNREYQQASTTRTPSPLRVPLPSDAGWLVRDEHLTYPQRGRLLVRASYYSVFPYWSVACEATGPPSAERGLVEVMRRTEIINEQGRRGPLPQGGRLWIVRISFSASLSFRSQRGCWTARGGLLHFGFSAGSSSFPVHLWFRSPSRRRSPVPPFKTGPVRFRTGPAFFLLVSLWAYFSAPFLFFRFRVMYRPVAPPTPARAIAAHSIGCPSSPVFGTL